MKRIILLIICLSALADVYSQAERNRWYFGYKAGLDFNTLQNGVTGFVGATPITVNGVPLALSNGPLSTWEGCFTMSDKAGNYLFASDGITVYNKTGAIMANGTLLKGHSSATQSGVVVPFPGSANRYVVLTCPVFSQGGVDHRHFYSIVNMAANGNLGEVEAASKNTPMPLTGTGYTTGQAYENIAVVGHANGVDYWIVSRYPAHFVVWPLTSAGIGNPIAYSAGPNGNFGNPGMLPPGWANDALGLGALKFSPDGSKIIFMDFSRERVSHANFNIATGQISGAAVVLNTGMSTPYGIEFSPSGEYVYMTVIQEAATNKNGLYIKKVSDLHIVPYARTLDKIVNVQMGPDYRLYCIAACYVGDCATATDLWIILNPDAGGTQIARIPNKFVVSQTAPEVGPKLGLPTFATTFAAFGSLTPEKVPICIGNNISFGINLPNVGSGAQLIGWLDWDFGDGTPVIRQPVTTAKIYNQPHVYAAPGTKTIKITPILAGSGLPVISKIVTETVSPIECVVRINRMIRVDLLGD